MLEECDITGEQISNNIQNKSPSKQMYSFSKAQRFPLNHSSNLYHFYNLPPLKSQRSTSMGYGKKSDFTKGKNLNLPFYNIQRLFEYNNGSPNYSFGSVLTSRVIEKSPGPGNYDIIKPIGFNSPKFSLGNKIHNIISKENFPGPGSYKNLLKLNLSGKYPLSKIKNSLMSGWSLSKSIRIQNYNNDVPAPNSYRIDNLFSSNGKIYNSKYKSYPGKSMLSRHGDFYQINQNPGPGCYEIFSEFGIYKKKFKLNNSKSFKSKSQENLNYLEKKEKDSKNNFENESNNKSEIESYRFKKNNVSNTNNNDKKNNYEENKKN